MKQGFFHPDYLDSSCKPVLSLLHVSGVGLKAVTTLCAHFFSTVRGRVYLRMKNGGGEEALREVLRNTLHRATGSRHLLSQKHILNSREKEPL